MSDKFIYVLAIDIPYEGYSAPLKAFESADEAITFWEELRRKSSADPDDPGSPTIFKVPIFPNEAETEEMDDPSPSSVVAAMMAAKAGA